MNIHNIVFKKCALIIFETIFRQDADFSNFSGIIEYSDRLKKWRKGNKSSIKWYNGTKFWYKDGKKHRIDGPAVEYSNGYKYWYIEGKEYPKKEYWDAIKNK